MTCMIYTLHPVASIPVDASNSIDARVAEFKDCCYELIIERRYCYPSGDDDELIRLPEKHVAMLLRPVLACQI